MADTTGWTVVLEDSSGAQMILQTTSGIYRLLDLRRNTLSLETPYLGVLVRNGFWHAFTGDPGAALAIAAQLEEGDLPMLRRRPSEVEMEPLVIALPVTRESALTAAEIADLAGANRRSAGTKLNAFSRKDERIQAEYDRDKRQNVWWRKA